ncbi:FAD-dependent monooxygenase [Sandaracinus amylolyticus]|nr:FAD-dependent monooxygenase [Sandaracinus amylolyticus]
MPTPPSVVIAGAGPAGMVLAYQLVGRGVPVRVLEQHPDFEREFRGELIGPSVLPALEQLDLVGTLVERGLARTDVERQMFVGLSRRVTLPGGTERGAVISQPGFLALLHERCSRHPHYRLDFRTTAMRAIREGERVVALETRREGATDRVDGDLFFVCSGRQSKVRKDLVTLELDEKPDDTLWLRFDLSDAPHALPSAVEVHMFGGGVVVVLSATTRSRLQVAYSAPGDVGALRKDLPRLRDALLPRIAEPLRSILAAKLDEHTESQVLRVAIDRLARWHVPGLMFLGDAAHTMGPAGAQGLNLAIRDSIVAANHVLDAIAEGRAVDDTLLAAIEAERRPEIEAAQAGQLRAYGMVQKRLAVQHVMFTILAAVMKVKPMPGFVSAPVMPKHATRA